MDLFHCNGLGARRLNNGAGRFFSIGNGTTLLKGFNNANASVNCGDLQDWASLANDTFNTSIGPGTSNALTTVDLRAMDVIGYNLVPEPLHVRNAGLGNRVALYLPPAQAFRVKRTEVAIIAITGRPSRRPFLSRLPPLAGYTGLFVKRGQAGRRAALDQRRPSASWSAACPAARFVGSRSKAPIC